MRNRSGIQGVASNPVLVGAVTVLVVLVAVFLAYNANNGLPFVSTYNLRAEVPNADALVKGNEVRIGGARVGVVKSVVPVQLDDGSVAAELSLSLDKNAEPLPVDSTMIIRPKSPLGLKYLQIVPGNSSKGFAAGETIPIAAARPEPVDIDQFFNMFDEKTRLAIRQNQAGFGNAFAGRGPQINAAIGALRLLVESGQPALRNLVAPSTNFGGFWRALEDLSATVAPVAESNGQPLRRPRPDLRRLRPGLAPLHPGNDLEGPLDAGRRQRRPAGAAALPARLRTLLHRASSRAPKRSPKPRRRSTPPRSAGIPVLNASPVFHAQLAPTADALLAFQEAPGVFNGLDLLIDTNEVLGPAIKFIAPAQTTCNYLTLAFGNLASATSEGNSLGNWLGLHRASSRPPAPTTRAARPRLRPTGPNPTTTSITTPTRTPPRPARPEECEAGNEPYKTGQTLIGNVPGNQGTKPAAS